jgi:16S rRNA U1498 N3-methylase RsmE
MPDKTDLKAKKKAAKEKRKVARQDVRYKKKVRRAKSKETLGRLTGNEVKQVKAEIKLDRLKTKRAKQLERRGRDMTKPLSDSKFDDEK